MQRNVLYKQIAISARTEAVAVRPIYPLTFSYGIGAAQIPVRIDGFCSGGSAANVLKLSSPLSDHPMYMKGSNRPETNGKDHVQAEYIFRYQLQKARHPLNPTFVGVLGQGSLSPKHPIYSRMVTKGAIPNNGDSWYFYLMKDGGISLTQAQSKGALTTPQFIKGTSELFQKLWKNGYSKVSVSLSPPERESRFEDFHVRRFEGRLEKLFQNAEARNWTVPVGGKLIPLTDFLRMPSFRINGRTVPNVLSYISKMLRDPLVREMTVPHVRNAVAHRDINPGNVVTTVDFPDSNYKLIDCHGWDPPAKKDELGDWFNCQEVAFDVAKMAFGWDLFNDIVHDNVTVRCSPEGEFTFEATPLLSNPDLRDAVYQMAAEDEAFAPIRELEPNFVSRVKFISVFQYLCDLYYRDNPEHVVAAVFQASIRFPELFPDLAVPEPPAEKSPR
jgi:hypothetical protein